MLVGYLVVLYISKHFGAEGVGVYGLTISAITLVAMVSGLGFNMSVLRYVGQFNKEKDQTKIKLLYLYLLEISVPFSVFLSVILYLLSDYIALEFLNDIRYGHTLKIAAFSIPFFSLLMLNIEYIRGLKNLKVSESLRSLSIPMLNMLLLLIAASLSDDKDMPIYTYAVAMLLTSIVSIAFIYVRLKKIRIDSRDSFKKRELINTSIPMLMTLLSTFIMGDVSLWFLQAFTTAKEVGVYNIIIKVSALIGLVLMVVNTISAPKFSELYWAKEYETLKKVIAQSTKLIFLASLGLSLVLIVLKEWILSVFGAEFVVGSDALVILIMAQLVNAVTGSVGLFLSMTGHQKILRNIIVATMMIGLVLNYLIIPVYGVYGAAIVSLLSSIIANLSSVYYVQTRLGYITYYIPGLLRSKIGK